MIINYSDQEVIKNKKAIFLAGPTPRNDDTKSWRKEACDLLEKLGFDGVVYVPEYSTWKPRANYDDQAQWERDTLCNSSVITFWIPRALPDMPAFTTNVEFGYWLHTGKVVYGRPDDARKIRYLDWLYKIDTGKEPYNDFEELIKASMELANKVGVPKNTVMLPLEDRKVMTNNK